MWGMQHARQRWDLHTNFVPSSCMCIASREFAFLTEASTRAAGVQRACADSRLKPHSRLQFLVAESFLVVVQLLLFCC